MESLHLLRTVDNNVNSLLSFSGDKNFQNLSKIANQSIRDLLNQENSFVLVFPDSLTMGLDRDNSTQVLCSLRSKDNNHYQLATGNIMGFIGVTDTTGFTTELSISSRFSPQNDFFLYYMLAKVFGLNIVDMNFSRGDDRIYNLLLFLFPSFLNVALNQGLYRQYQWYQHNDSKAKGIVDIPRHICLNEPFTGKIAYHTRDYSYDNDMTELIRHTIEYVKTTENGNDVLNKSSEIRKNVARIEAATPKYKKSNLHQILLRNQKSVPHPFYVKYRPLQVLCKAILLRENTSFGAMKEKIYGILFDGSWLWEEYISSVLQTIDNGIIHKKYCDSLFAKDDCRKGQGIIPDFIKYKDKPKTASFIGDTKYKHIDTKNNREDYFQIITYMYRYSCPTGCLIYPYDKTSKNESLTRIHRQERIIAKESLSDKVVELGLKISTCETSFESFAEDMHQNEVCFCNEILNNQ